MNAGDFYTKLYQLPVEELILKLNSMGIPCQSPVLIKASLIRPNMDAISDMFSRPKQGGNKERVLRELTRRVEVLPSYLLVVVSTQKHHLKHAKLTKILNYVDQLLDTAYEIECSDALELVETLGAFRGVIYLLSEAQRSRDSKDKPIEVH